MRSKQDALDTIRGFLNSERYLKDNYSTDEAFKTVQSYMSESKEPSKFTVTFNDKTYTFVMYRQVNGSDWYAHCEEVMGAASPGKTIEEALFGGICDLKCILQGEYPSPVYQEVFSKQGQR